MKILVLTSTRADYGILQPVLRALQCAPDVDLGLLVTGTHLSPEHGRTALDVERDEFNVVARPPILMADDQAGSMARAAGLGLLAFSEVVERWEPDRALVLGDRFEALAFAMTCHLMNVPLAHVHGGEVTVGAIDDACRHAITKMATMHLTASDEFARRIRQLGEERDRIHVVGAPGLDGIMAFREKLLAVPVRQGRAVVTYHPVTAADEPAGESARAVLDGCLEAGLTEIVVTGANADRGHSEVAVVLHEYADRFDQIQLFDSLGAERYREQVRGSVVVVGNSSSGLIEAPFLGTPTVDVGERQTGRPAEASVLRVPPDARAIAAAIAVAVGWKPDLPVFETTLYGDGHAADRIVKHLTALGPPGVKVFQDYGVED